MKRLVDSIVDFYIAKEIIDKEWKELYISGLTLLLSETMNFLLILCMGTISGHFAESVTYLLVFCSLRGFTGGFHAKRHWICRTVMLASFLGVLLVSQLLQTIPSLYYTGVLVTLICIVSFFVIYKLAPVEHPNKPLTPEQRQKNGKRAKMVSFIYLVVSAIGSLLFKGVFYTSLLTICLVAILMIPGKKKK